MMAYVAEVESEKVGVMMSPVELILALDDSEKMSEEHVVY